MKMHSGAKAGWSWNTVMMTSSNANCLFMLNCESAETYSDYSPRVSVLQSELSMDSRSVSTLPLSAAMYRSG